MTTRQLIIPLIIILLSTLALYLLIAFPLLQDGNPLSVESESGSQPGDVPRPGLADDKRTAPLPTTATASSRSDTPQGGRKLVEIFGRVVDPDQQPIAAAVIAEERYFARTRSDGEGYYKLLVELPRHRYPVLHFLRSGYDGRRIKLGKKELDGQSIYQLDVSLRPAVNSVNLQGWVADQLGIGLEGARVELSASYTRNTDSYYLTGFTDENGRFEFDGVRSGETYKLTVNLTPEYTFYEDEDFIVTQNPAALNIVLQQLKFVDVGGMVVNRASEPVGNYEIYVTNVTTGTHSRKIVSDSSGFFLLKHFPLGEISLSTRGPEYYRISGMSLDDEAYQNLQIVVDRGNHFFTGWVSNESGTSVERAMVTIDRKFKQDGVEYTSYRSQNTGADGKFAFDSLGGGEHHITVYSWGYEKQEFDYRFDQQANELYITLKPSP